MRFKGRMALEHGLESIDIAPIVNIVFLLLLFFMLTSSFVMQPGITVDLPRALTSEVLKPENIEILITSENTTYLNSKTVTLSDLKAFLKQAAKRNHTILIKADKQASLGRVVEIWDLARGLGFSQINIATNKE